MGGEITLTTTRPEGPEQADFALYIDFKKGIGSPERVFQTADAMIRALQRLDHVLCDAIDTSIEPVMFLEEIEAGSIKVWLSNRLKSVDDQALKDLDWRLLIGKYLGPGVFLTTTLASYRCPTALDAPHISIILEIWIRRPP